MELRAAETAHVAMEQQQQQQQQQQHAPSSAFARYRGVLRGTDPRWIAAREHGRSRLPKYQGTPYGDKELLEPGDDDEDARPYPLLPPWGWTSVLDLGEFGLGIGLYFGMLRDLAVVFVVVGLVNLPSMMYFASKAYNGGSSG